MDIQSLLDLAVKGLKSKFGGDLVSVTLFGSHCRDNFRPYSDLDLLIVVDNLPSDWRARGRIALSIEEIGLDIGKAIQVILVTPQDVNYSVENIAPLMLEIYDAHRILFDQGGFLYKQMVAFKQNLKKRRGRKIKQGVWEIPELAEA